MLSFILQQGLPYGYIANVCVDKSSRKQGIASTLMECAVQVGRSWGKIQLHFLYENVLLFGAYGNTYNVEMTTDLHGAFYDLITGFRIVLSAASNFFKDCTA